MSKYAVMPLTDYVAACDAIREKMGDSEAIKSGDMAEEIGKVYKAGKLAILAESNYMHPTVSGEVISVNDVNALEHSLGVNVRSKNLIPYPYAQTTRTENGITFTDNGDGSITVNGTATADVTFICRPLNLLGTFTLSGAIGGSATTYYLGLGSSDFKDIGDGVTRTYATTITSNIFIRVVKGAVIDNITIYPQLELGTTATKYTPYISDLSAVSISRYGKNLLSDINIWNNPIIYNATPIYMKAGEFYTFSIDTDYSDFRFMLYGTEPDGTPFRQYADGSTSSSNNYYLEGFYTGTAGRLQKSANMATNTYTTKCIRDCIITAFQFWNIGTAGAYFKNGQFELGATATDYEPYKEAQTVTANADGTVEGLTSVSPNMTIMTDTDGVIINCQYYRDIDTYIDNLITDVAITGGE